MLCSILGHESKDIICYIQHIFRGIYAYIFDLFFIHFVGWSESVRERKRPMDLGCCRKG